MVEVLEDLQPLLDDVVRPVPLDVGDEADAAGIVLVHRVVQALRLHRAGARGRRTVESLIHAALHSSKTSRGSKNTAPQQKAQEFGVSLPPFRRMAERRSE
jgi:hypothetical protein